MTKGGERDKMKKNLEGQDAIKNKKKMKKNMQRLGGGKGKGGLSLETFANAKTRTSRTDAYNPALIKRQREFYKNAKYVSKYKRSIKQQEQHNGRSTLLEGDNETVKHNVYNKQQNKKSKKNAPSLEELYEKKHKEEEKALLEREAMMQTKKEERQQAEARRKSLKEKMYKKTRSGQPVMKYRIEHLLETISGSTS